MEINDTNKTTVRANANIAVAKYWGKRDIGLNLPCFDSVSFCVDGLMTETTAIWQDDVMDTLTVNGLRMSVTKVRKILDEIRFKTGIKKGCVLTSVNKFPTASGLASSASGCAATAVAASRAAGLMCTQEQLSILARLGSGSACRSIPGGWCRWHAGVRDDGSDSFATQIAPFDHWPLCIFVVLVSDEKKPVSSTSCMISSMKSPFWDAYVGEASQSADIAQAAIEHKNFRALADTMHHNAMMLHALVMTCKPPVCYFAPDSIKVLKYVLDVTRQMDVCCTLDAGSNVVILCDPSCRDKVSKDLSDMGVNYLETGIGGGVEII